MKKKHSMKSQKCYQRASLRRTQIQAQFIISALSSAHSPSSFRFSLFSFVVFFCYRCNKQKYPENQKMS